MSHPWQPADGKPPRAFHLPELVAEPEEWRVLDDFNWNREIVVEVGCGTGEWGLSQAQKHPQRFYLAVERTFNRSQQLASLSERFRLANHLALRADAVLLFGHKFPRQSVSELVFFYPNPCPKKRQANLRYFVSSAFQVFHDVLKPSGKILLTSNISAYVREARFYLEKYWGYHVIYDGAARFDAPRTQFERKYHLAGEELVELEVGKI